MQNHQQLKVLFYLNREKTSKDGHASIWVSITINSCQKLFSPGVKQYQRGHQKTLSDLRPVMIPQDHYSLSCGLQPC